MPNLTFIGKVLPERATLDLSGALPLEMEYAAGNKLALTANIHANQIIVRLLVPPAAPFDLATLRNMVEEQVQVIVNFCGYVSGIGWDIEIISVVDNETGSVTVFGRDLPVTQETPEIRKKRFSELFATVGMSHVVGLALADLRAAIRYPADTAVHCYRAFEAIASEFHVPGQSQEQMLESMSSALRLGPGKGLRKFLGSRAAKRRHGKIDPISWADRKAVMQRIWFVMDRYLEYLKRGRISLPAADFPTPHFE